MKREISDEVRTLAEQSRIKMAGESLYWNDELLDSYLKEGQLLWGTLQRRCSGLHQHSVGLYFELVSRGIAAGLLKKAKESRGSLLAYILSYPLRAWFNKTDCAVHANIAADIWNIAEGVRQMEPWVEQYLISRVSVYTDSLNLKDEIVSYLKPVLEAPKQSNWSGSFSVTTIDLGHFDRSGGFLPGPMQLVGPSLVRVAERRGNRPVGILLEPGNSRCIGGLGESLDVVEQEPASVAITFSDSTVNIDGQSVALPLMGCEPENTLVVNSGYILATAANSRQIWVVEVQE